MAAAPSPMVTSSNEHLDGFEHSVVPWNPAATPNDPTEALLGKDAHRKSSSTHVMTAKPIRTKHVHGHKKRNLMRTLVPLFRLMTVLFTFASGILFTIILIRVIRKGLHSHDYWDFLPEPPAFDFHSVSISSSSETCNEMGREFAQDDRSVLFLGLFMTTCLYLAEPQSSGLGGSSVFIYADAEKEMCREGSGYAKMFASLAPLRRELRVEQHAEHIGTYSAAIPTEIRTILAMFELYHNHTNDDSTEFVKILPLWANETLSTMRLPVSYALDKALKWKNLDQYMTFRDDFRSFFGNELSVIQEGDLYKPNMEIVENIKILGEAFDNSQNITVEKVDEMFREHRHLFTKKTNYGAGLKANWIRELTRTPYIRELKSLSNISRPKQKGDTNAEKNHNLLFCGSYSSDFESNLVQYALLNSSIGQNLSDLAKETEKSVNDWTTNYQFYHIIYQAIMKIYEHVGKKASTLTSKSKEQNHAKEQHRLLKEMAKIERTRQEFLHSSNVLTIVNHKTNQAIAMTSTLGTSFGSLTTGLGGAMILNNMMSGVGKFYNITKDHHNNQQPMIIIENGKIAAAYAGSGGFFSKSWDIGRMLTSLSLNLLAPTKIPIERALTTPLFLRLPSNKSMITKGMPWNVANKLREVDGKWSDPRTDLLDIVSVVSGKRTVFFDGAPREGRLMPNGF